MFKLFSRRLACYQMGKIIPNFSSSVTERKLTSIGLIFRKMKRFVFCFVQQSHGPLFESFLETPLLPRDYEQLWANVGRKLKRDERVVVPDRAEGQDRTCIQTCSFYQTFTETLLEILDLWCKLNLLPAEFQFFSLKSLNAVNLSQRWVLLQGQGCSCSPWRPYLSATYSIHSFTTTGECVFVHY